MLRAGGRFSTLLCTAYGRAGGAEEDDRRRDPRSPGGFGMPLRDAYQIFGYNLSDRIEQKEVKKRFQKLAKVMHPDRGGKPEEFLKLVEAHKIMQSHRHDVGETKGAGGRAKVRNVFHKASRSAALNNVDRDNRIEAQSVDVSDAFAVLIVFPIMCACYYWYQRDTVTRLSDARSRMSEAEMRPQKAQENERHEWHPWRAGSETRKEVEAVLADRRQRLGLAEPENVTTHMPQALAAAAATAAESSATTSGDTAPLPEAAAPGTIDRSNSGEAFLPVRESSPPDVSAQPRRAASPFAR
jgi:hypothetical protein